MFNNIHKYIICTLLCCYSALVYAHIGTPTNDVSIDAVVNSVLNKRSAIQKIVIDAGHGGKDSGCQGANSSEKNIALKISLKLGALINYYHPEIEVIYTRKTDVFIPLFKRAEIANKNNADLFISIHCNAIAGGNARGTETFVMGLHTAEENLEVAKRENASILLEENYVENYDGYNPNSPEGHIILSMVQNAYLERSIQLAQKIENSFTLRTGMKSRGVKQAGFVVLRKTTMPSVLVEAGFLSANGDEYLLQTSEGQDKLAQALIKALTEYKRELDKNLKWEEDNTTQSTRVVDATSSPSNSHSNPKETQAQTQTQTQTSPTHYANGSTSVANTQTTNHTSTVSTPTAAQNPPRVVHRVINQPIIYKVQIAASQNKPINNRKGKWSMVKDLEIRQEENLYKYLTGHFYFMEEAEELRAEMLRLGFKGAFIVGYRENIRLKI